jgi:hypothetical protein
VQGAVLLAGNIAAVRFAVALAPLLAGCAILSDGPPVEVSAADAEGGVRVRFRRTRPGVMENLARVEATGGEVAEVLHSPDLLNVAVSWKRPEGELRCAFAYGGEAAFPAGGPRDPGRIEYVFLKCAWAEVTASLPRGCPMTGALPLSVCVEASRLPARLDVAGRPPLPLQSSGAVACIDLPRALAGVLAAGEIELTLRSARGEAASFLVGVDPDGTPVALTGFVRNW